MHEDFPTKDCFQEQEIEIEIAMRGHLCEEKLENIFYSCFCIVFPDIIKSMRTLSSDRNEFHFI